MARVAYLIEVNPAHLGPLGYVAGILQAQGVPQGQILADLLQNVQVVEVPDDFGATAEADTSTWEDEGGATLPEEEELEEITPENDPTAPENLGIDLGDRPPERAGDFIPQSSAGDFGAGAGPS